MADENKRAIEYKGDNSIIVNAPAASNDRYVAYVRPNDEIVFGFNITDDSFVRFEFIKGDVQAVFKNGATINFVGLSAIGFADNAPIIKDSDGTIYSLTEFLNTVEVLNYDEAVLIVALQDDKNTSDVKPEIVKSSTVRESDNDAGIPISGDGDSDILLQGVPRFVIDPLAVSLLEATDTGTESFVSTIWTSNDPFLFDKSNYLPGNSTYTEGTQLTVTVFYGGELKQVGNVDIGGTLFSGYSFDNGLAYTDDPLTQLVPIEEDFSGNTDNMFIDNNSLSMKYVVELEYIGTIQPTSIDIVIPSLVADTLVLTGKDGLNLGDGREDEDGNMIYSIKEISPTGKMYYELSFASDIPDTSFDITYNVLYFSEDTGKVEEVSITSGVQITDVTTEDQLSSSDNVLSKVANPLDIMSGRGNDILITGGGDNTANSGSGDDIVFSYSGSDTIDLGEGNDILLGSIGDDVVKAGAGDDVIYYNNKDLSLDSTGDYIPLEYYNTYQIEYGLVGYLGLSENDLKLVTPADYINDDEITQDSFLIFASDTYNIINNFETVYLSNYDDIVYISDQYVSNFTVYANDNSSNNDQDQLIIHESFSTSYTKTIGGQTYSISSEIEIAQGALNQAVISGSKGNVATVYDFELYLGADDTNDYFASNVMANKSTDLDYTINGGKSNNPFSPDKDILDYSVMAKGYHVEFDANTGMINKYNSSDEQYGYDSVINIEVFSSSNDGDMIYGAYLNDYEYINLETTDTIDYSRSDGGVIWSIDQNKIYKTTNISNITNADYDLIDQVGLFDSNTDYNTTHNLVLTNNTDIILGTSSYNVTIDAGFGNDILNYAHSGFSDSITVDMSGGVGEVTYSGSGNKTTFDILLSGASGSVNIYSIVGSAQSDEFIMGDVAVTSGGETHFFDGGIGDDILDYSKLTNTGVTFNFASSNFVYKSSGGTATGTDYFDNMETYVGSGGNDNVIISASYTNYTDFFGYQFDLGAGDSDKIQYSSLDLASAGLDYIEVRYTSNDLSVDYIDSSSSVGTSVFKNTEFVVGTLGDDKVIIDNVVTNDIGFDGFNGTDTADYSAITNDITFSLYDDKVEYDGKKDQIRNTEIFMSGEGANTYLLDARTAYTIQGNAVASSTSTVSYQQSSYAVTVVYNDPTNVEVSKGPSTNIIKDTLSEVDSVIGSDKSDTFIIDAAFTSSTRQTIIGTDPSSSSSDADIVDFSALTIVGSSSIALDSSANKFVEFNYGGIDWRLESVEGIIAGNQDDVFQIIGGNDIFWQIDGGKGDDTVDYTLDTSMSAAELNIVDTAISVSRTESAGSPVNDTLYNIEILKLANQVNDFVSLGAGFELNSLTTLDAGSGTTDKDVVSLANYDSSDIELTFNGTQFVFTSPSAFVMQNFEVIELGKLVSTVVMEAGIIADDIYIYGNASATASAVMDFSAIGMTSITLAQDNTTADKLAGDLNGNIYFIDINTIQLSQTSASTVYASSGKHIDFVGDKNDTLDYKNFSATGITIDWGTKTIFKFSNDNTSVDTFLDIAFINGTANDDRLIITDLTQLGDFSSVVVNLDSSAGGSSDNDILIFDIQLSASYNLANNELNGNTLSGILGIERVELSSNDDVLTIDSTYSKGTSQYSYFDGADGMADTIDLSTSASYMFVDISNSSAAITFSSQNSFGDTYTGMTWDLDVNGNIIKLDNFEQVIFSDKGTTVFGGALGNYSYLGGSSTDDVIDYSQGTIAINIDLTAKSIAVGMDKSTFDDKIDTIIGTSEGDVIVIDETVNLVNVLTIDAAGGSNRVTFASSSEGLQQFAITNTDVEFEYSTGGPQVLKFQNIERYVLTDHDDTVVLDSDVSANVSILATASSSVMDSDRVIYHGINSADTIEYQVSSNQVIRNLASAGMTYIDSMSSFEEIGYYGESNFIIDVGSNINNLTYIYDPESASTTATYMTLDYGIMDQISVDFDYSANSNKILIDKELGGQSGQDTMDIGSLVSASQALNLTIKSALDSSVFEVYDLSALNLLNITIDGSKGLLDVVSFANDTRLDFSESDLTVGTTGYAFSGIEGYSLNDQNNKYTAGISATFTGKLIDGSGGSDTLDYSALSALTSDTVKVDFATGVVLKDVSGTSAYDSIDNFEAVITGDSQDTIILSDDFVNSTNTLGTIDTQGGEDTVSMTALTIVTDIVLDYGDTGGFDSSIKYNAGTSIAYSGVENYDFDSQNVTINYYYDSSHVLSSGNLIRLHAKDGMTNIFNFAGTGVGLSFTFYADNTYSQIANNSKNIFMQLEGFKEINANTADTLNVVVLATDTSKYHYTGGDTAGDTIDYSSFSKGVQLTFSGADAVVKSTSSDPNAEKLTKIENIILTNNRDEITLDDGTYLGGQAGNIDAGGGEDVLNIGGSTALNVDLDDTGIALGGGTSGWTISNTEITGLSDQSDTLNIKNNVASGIIVSGADGDDTADFTDFNTLASSSVFLVRNKQEGSIQAQVVNNVGNLVVINLESFEVFTLTNETDQFLYTAISDTPTAGAPMFDNNAVTIDMADGDDIVNFKNSNLESNNLLTFTYSANSDMLEVHDKTSKLATYTFKSANNIFGSNKADTFVITDVNSTATNATIDADDGIDILDLAGYTNSSAGDKKFDVTTGQLDSSSYLIYHIEQIILGGDLKEIVLGDTDKFADSVNYVVDINGATDVIINYSIDNTKNSLDVVLDGDIIINKRSNTYLDTIKDTASGGTITSVTLSNYKDTLVIKNATNFDVITIDGGGDSYDEVDYNLSTYFTGDLNLLWNSNGLSETSASDIPYLINFEVFKLTDSTNNNVELDLSTAVLPAVSSFSQMVMGNSGNTLTLTDSLLSGGYVASLIITSDADQSLNLSGNSLGPTKVGLEYFSTFDFSAMASTTVNVRSIDIDYQVTGNATGVSDTVNLANLSSSGVDFKIDGANNSWTVNESGSSYILTLEYFDIVSLTDSADIIVLSSAYSVANEFTIRARGGDNILEVNYDENLLINSNAAIQIFDPTTNGTAGTFVDIYQLDLENATSQVLYFDDNSVIKGIDDILWDSNDTLDFSKRTIGVQVYILSQYATSAVLPGATAPATLVFGSQRLSFDDKMFIKDDSKLVLTDSDDTFILDYYDNGNTPIGFTDDFDLTSGTIDMADGYDEFRVRTATQAPDGNNLYGKGNTVTEGGEIIFDDSTNTIVVQGAEYFETSTKNGASAMSPQVYLSGITSDIKISTTAISFRDFTNNDSADNTIDIKGVGSSYTANTNQLANNNYDIKYNGAVQQVYLKHYGNAYAHNGIFMHELTATQLSNITTINVDYTNEVSIAEIINSSDNFIGTLLLPNFTTNTFTWDGDREGNKVLHEVYIDSGKPEYLQSGAIADTVQTVEIKGLMLASNIDDLIVQTANINVYVNSDDNAVMRNMEITAGGTRDSFELGAGINGTLANSVVTTDNSVTYTLHGFETISTSNPLSLLFDDNHTNNATLNGVDNDIDNDVSGVFYDLSDDAVDTIYIDHIENNSVIDTGIGLDRLYLTGSYDIAVEYSDGFSVNGEYYDTSSSGYYIILHDNDGNEMFIINSDLDDVAYYNNAEDDDSNAYNNQYNSINDDTNTNENDNLYSNGDDGVSSFSLTASGQDKSDNHDSDLALENIFNYINNNSTSGDQVVDNDHLNTLDITKADILEEADNIDNLLSEVLDQIIDHNDNNDLMSDDVATISQLDHDAGVDNESAVESSYKLDSESGDHYLQATNYLLHKHNVNNSNNHGI